MNYFVKEKKEKTNRDREREREKLREIEKWKIILIFLKKTKN